MLPDDIVPLLDAADPWEGGVEPLRIPPELDVPELGAIDPDVEPGAPVPVVGAMPSLDGAIAPELGAIAPELGAIAPALAGAVVEVFAPLSVADMAPLVVAGVVSSVFWPQAATDSAAALAAMIIKVFMDFSLKRPPGPGWPAIVSSHDRVRM